MLCNKIFSFITLCLLEFLLFFDLDVFESESNKSGFNSTSRNNTKRRDDFPAIIQFVFHKVSFNKK
jgi:hypothetical protein